MQNAPKTHTHAPIHAYALHLHKYRHAHAQSHAQAHAQAQAHEHPHAHAYTSTHPHTRAYTCSYVKPVYLYTITKSCQVLNVFPSAVLDYPQPVVMTVRDSRQKIEHGSNAYWVEHFYSERKTHTTPSIKKMLQRLPPLSPPPPYGAIPRAAVK